MCFLKDDRVRKQPGGLLNNRAVHVSIGFTESVSVLHLSLGDGRIIIKQSSISIPDTLRLRSDLRLRTRYCGSDTPSISFIYFLGAFDSPAVRLCVLVDGENHEGI